MVARVAQDNHRVPIEPAAKSGEPTGSGNRVRRCRPVDAWRPMQPTGCPSQIWCSGVHFRGPAFASADDSNHPLGSRIFLVMLATRPRFNDLSAAASGRWVSLLGAAGLSADLLDGRGHPCPRCGGRDRFAAWRDVDIRGAVHCRRCFTGGCDPSPGSGLATLRWWRGGSWRDAGDYLHHLLGGAAVPVVGVSVSSPVSRWPTPAAVDRTDLANRHAAAARRAGWSAVERDLRLPATSLNALGAGFCAKSQATTWPMWDDRRRAVGIRYRSTGGGSGATKWSLAGSIAGVFWPRDVDGDLPRLYLPEGPTDTAAMHAAGLPAIGRPSARGGSSIVMAVLGRLMPEEIVVVGDRDDAGVEAARWWRRRLVDRGYAARCIVPPTGFKDVRQWIAGGATGVTIHESAETARRWYWPMLFE